MTDKQPLVELSLYDERYIANM